MTRFNLGIFVDAHHILATDRAYQSARTVLDRIEIAASQLCMAGGISYGVVTADCAVTAARRIAEEFGHEGFRIRHVPESQALSRDQVLAAEAMEARAARPELQAIAVVGEPQAYLPLVGPLHRAGCAVIGCTAGAAGAAGGVDEVITLPLNRQDQRDLVLQALGTLAGQGIRQTSIAGLENAMRRIDPGYSGKLYKVSVKRVLQQLTEPWLTFTEPDRVRISGAGAEWAKSAADLGSAGNASQNSADLTGRPVANGHEPTSHDGSAGVNHNEVAAACRDLTRLGDEADLGATVGALRAVLAVLAAAPALRAAALNGGIPVSAVSKGLAAVAPQYKRVGRFTELGPLAIEGTCWTIWKNPEKVADIRFRLTPVTPSPAMSEEATDG
jgi:hypothetical protein